MNLNAKWDDDVYKKTGLVLKYILINGIFLASVYLGFIDTEFESLHNGAQNLALFIGWTFGILGLIVVVGLAKNHTETGVSALEEAISRKEPSVIPYPIDLTYDLIILCIFVWFQVHYMFLAIAYIFNMVASKELRDIPKDVMLKKLKSQQGK